MTIISDCILLLLQQATTQAIIIERHSKLPTTITKQIHQNVHIQPSQQQQQFCQQQLPDVVGQQPLMLQQYCGQFCTKQLLLISYLFSFVQNNIIHLICATFMIKIYQLHCFNIQMINLIDQKGKFNQLLKDYPNSIANIAIFGTQSSGKSTLMNRAFETHFQVLDSKQQRKRCTKGVWLQNNGRFNLIDTQGFDSVERSNEQRIFQRQVALFCLSLADVIVINIWMNQIGRYHGSQTHILKAIISSANYLLQSQTKTLLFVVKDCTRDANHEVLKQQMDNTIKKILNQSSSKNKKTLKFNIEYFFMSHFIRQPEQYQKQAKKLSSIIKVKKSNLSQYQPTDRIVYLSNLWTKIISNDGQIDLRVQEQALRLYVVNRIRVEAKNHIQKQVLKEIKIGKLNSYERLYQFFVKRSFDMIKSRLPKYVDDQTIKNQFFLIEEELQYIIQNHFNKTILPNQQKALLDFHLNKQLEKSVNSIQLEKIITEQRKKVLHLYKLLVQGHKQSQILIKRFAQKITQESVLYERQVGYLFNMFETRLQSEINQQLDKQTKKLKFDGPKITEKFKNLCKQFQYNQWEVNTKEIWQKASHRVLTQRLIIKIEDFLNQHNTHTMFSVDKEAQIISDHKKLEKEVEKFIQSLLQYFQQQDTGLQYKERAKQKIRDSLQNALIQQKKRFRISMLILSIFLIFFYSECMRLLKMMGLKKRTRNNFSYFYMIMVAIMIAGSIYKKFAHTRASLR